MPIHTQAEIEAWNEPSRIVEFAVESRLRGVLKEKAKVSAKVSVLSHTMYAPVDFAHVINYKRN